jgi:hypothetical protein
VSSIGCSPGPQCSTHHELRNTMAAVYNLVRSGSISDYGVIEQGMHLKRRRHDLQYMAGTQPGTPHTPIPCIYASRKQCTQNNDALPIARRARQAVEKWARGPRATRTGRSWTAYLTR